MHGPWVTTTQKHSQEQNVDGKLQHIQYLQRE